MEKRATKDLTCYCGECLCGRQRYLFFYSLIRQCGRQQGVELTIKALREAKGGETFISKVPSFKLTDLAQAMLPGCQMPEVGIREGEKLHEIMVTVEDSFTTYEYEKYFVMCGATKSVLCLLGSA